MSRVLVDLDALRHNLSVVGSWMQSHGATWIAVTKALCGHREILKAMKLMGVRAVGDSRLENLTAVSEIFADREAWYLRGPAPNCIEDVVTYASVSLNTEIETIEAISQTAQAMNRQHGIVIMIELGDLREGILPGHLMRFYEEVFTLPNVRVLGVGANLGCLAGAVPNIDQLMQLILYRELLELKFERQLPIISAGTTAVLPLLLSGDLPRAINHFRIGEALFLGTDLIHGGTLKYLRNDVVTLESEISEIKQKGLTPLAETAAVSRFDDSAGPEETTPGKRGYRAVVNVGYLDTDIAGLTPVNPDFHIAGGSSDVTVVNLGEDPQGLSVGDPIQFRVNYSALLRLMSGKYVEKRLSPPLAELELRLVEAPTTVAQPVLAQTPA